MGGNVNKRRPGSNGSFRRPRVVRLFPIENRVNLREICETRTASNEEEEEDKEEEEDEEEEEEEEEEDDDDEEEEEEEWCVRIVILLTP